MSVPHKQKAAHRAGLVTGPVRVVGVDPGPVPGVAVLSFADGWPLSASVFQCDADSVLWLIRPASLVPPGKLADTFPERIVLAVERFVIGPRSSHLATPRAAATTRDMVGAVIELGRELAGVTVVQRCAAEVMPWATDRRLAAAGLLTVTKTMPHARAAARHALFAAVRDGGLPDPLSAKVRAR